MAKYYGFVGFAIQQETPEGSGIYEEHITERPYCGDLLRNIRRTQSSTDVNDSYVLNNQISIIADAYAMENYEHISYVTYLSGRWKVSAAQIEPPRIVLDMGGVYNGPEPEKT